MILYSLADDDFNKTVDYRVLDKLINNTSGYNSFTQDRRNNKRVLTSLESVPEGRNQIYDVLQVMILNDNKDRKLNLTHPIFKYTENNNPDASIQLLLSHDNRLLKHNSNVENSDEIERSREMYEYHKDKKRINDIASNYYGFRNSNRYR